MDEDPGAKVEPSAPPAEPVANAEPSADAEAGATAEPGADAEVGVGGNKEASHVDVDVGIYTQQCCTARGVEGVV